MIIDLVSKLRSDALEGIKGRLKVGDSCPVCDRMITKLVAQRIGIYRPEKVKK